MGIHRLVVIIAAIGVILAAGSAAATGLRRADATHPRGSLPAPCGESSCQKTCLVGIDFFSCESRNPTATVTYNGEASGCDYAVQISWGDGSSKTVDFTQPPGLPQDDEPALVQTHTYTATGVYIVKLVPMELASPSGCTALAPPTLEYPVSILAGHYRVAAVGDSFSAGEGTFDYTSSSRCHRSRSAWPELLPSDSDGRVASVTLIACSGTDSRRLRGGDNGGRNFPNQFAALRKMKPDLVTVTIGGNDVGFARVLRDCYDPRRNCVRDGTLARLSRDIAAEPRRLVEDYIDIADLAPRARILVVDYPILFTRDTEQGLDIDHCGWLDFPVKRDDLWLDNYELDSAIQQAVADANRDLERRGSDNRLEFVDVSDAFAGHELCTKNPWVNNLELVAGMHGAQELGHPTTAGQEALGADVGGYIGANL